MIEGAKINQSLLVLGNCIKALVNQVEKNKATFIPFRGSKLTRLLKVKAVRKKKNSFRTLSEEIAERS